MYIQNLFLNGLCVYAVNTQSPLKLSELIARYEKSNGIQKGRYDYMTVHQTEKGLVLC